MDKKEFLKSLSPIKSATSVTGKVYKIIRIRARQIDFIRPDKSEVESICIDELYKLYTNEQDINTSIAKQYISGRKQSPAVAILSEINVVRPAISREILPDNKEEMIKKKSISRADSDEARFFKAFVEIVGESYLQSKSIGKPISSSHIFLSNNYCNYDFSPEVLSCYDQILSDLKSDKTFNGRSLSSNIDGLVVHHPILLSRIVEFDEEQHFTPARSETLKHLCKISASQYLYRFQEICNKELYLNNEVLKKHRIKNKLQTMPNSFADFLSWLQQSNEESSNFISSKNGFGFLGGRIAQRAYYDSLRDTAHLSPKNIGLASPLRFAKHTFENLENRKFNVIPINKIREQIIKILRDDYQVSL